MSESDLTWETPGLAGSLLTTEEFGATSLGEWKAAACAALRKTVPAARTPELLEEAEALDLAGWMERVGL
jgi:L-arabinose isomerase